MKNRDLIRLLQMLEPDEEVTFDVGMNAEDKEIIAKAAVVDNSELECMIIHNVSVYPEADGTLSAIVTLCQKNGDLIETSERFDDVYSKI